MMSKDGTRDKVTLYGGPRPSYVPKRGNQRGGRGDGRAHNGGRQYQGRGGLHDFQDNGLGPQSGRYYQQRPNDSFHQDLKCRQICNKRGFEMDCTPSAQPVSFVPDQRPNYQPGVNHGGGGRGRGGGPRGRSTGRRGNYGQGNAGHGRYGNSGNQPNSNRYENLRKQGVNVNVNTVTIIEDNGNVPANATSTQVVHQALPVPPRMVVPGLQQMPQQPFVYAPNGMPYMPLPMPANFMQPALMQAQPFSAPAAPLHTVAAASFAVNSASLANPWIVDSGAGQALTGPQLPEGVEQIQTTTARAIMANGAEAKIGHKAKLNGLPIYSVSDPNFKTNLLSVGQAAEVWGNKFLFMERSCLVLKKGAVITINSSDILSDIPRNEAGLYVMTDREFNRSFKR